MVKVKKSKTLQKYSKYLDTLPDMNPTLKKHLLKIEEKREKDEKLFNKVVDMPPTLEDISYPSNFGFIRRILFRRECQGIIKEWDSLLDEEKFMSKEYYFNKFWKRVNYKPY